MLSRPTPAPSSAAVCSNPMPSSLTSSVQTLVVGVQPHLDQLSAGVLGGVLHRLHAAEVERCLDRTGQPAHGLGAHRDRDRAGRHRGDQGRREPFVGQQPWVDAARQQGQRLDRGRGPHRPARRARRRRASGERPATVWASRRLTARATRCCWAPSWMSRSSRRRSWSWVSMSRARDTFSSSGPPQQLLVTTFQLGPKTGQAAAPDRPAPPDPLNSRSSTAVSAIPGRSWSRSTPSVLVAVAHGAGHACRHLSRPGRRAAAAAGSPPGGRRSGQVAARVSRSATVSHTWAHCAPVPWASSIDIRDGSSSAV